jgi:Protein of unknown function (DUF3099)
MRLKRRATAANKNVVVASITSAPEGLSVDQSGRQKRYFYSMMLRTLCFILAVALPSPYRWIALAGAVVLPYVSVIIANAGRETIAGKAFRPFTSQNEIGQ